LYDRVAGQSVIGEINAVDQGGVDLGKQMSDSLF